MELKVIASGSKGNCYILDNGKDLLLLEAGISKKDILLNVDDVSRIVGCLITHEHKDHSKYALAILNLQIKLFLSGGTINTLPNVKKSNLVQIIEPKSRFTIGSYTILAFDVVHDAEEPLGFLIKDNVSKEKVLFVTDTWYLKYKFPDVDYWLVECNFIQSIADEQLNNNEISESLIKRIRTSHMSLEMLKETLMANDLSNTSKIVLLHLSSARSDEIVMAKEIADITGIETVVASKCKKISLTKTPF